MPSLDHPAEYTRADYIMPGRTDQFFKWFLSRTDPYEYTGTTESPLGYVSICNVTSVDIATYVAEEGEPWFSETRNMPPGHYICREDDLGFIWAMHYGTAEALAADFAEAEAVYAAWDADV